MDETIEDFKVKDNSQLDTSANDNEAEAKLRLFIKLIGSQPAIFNPKHEDYRSNPAKDVLWSNISKRVGWTERFCKTKWKALRNQYCRELKRVRLNSKAVIKWQYFQSLKFLRPYALHRDYRIKVPNRPVITNEYAYQKETNNKPASTAQNWNSYNESSHINESVDMASQDIDQKAQEDTVAVQGDEDPQDDDDDDDPIHTFLRIESYFEKQLITMVQSEDVLYNHQNPLYRNPKVKMSTWDEIARKLKRTSMQCRIKWKSLRDQYIREHKRIMSTNSRNSMPRWKHYDSLRFLENFIRVKNSSSFDNSNIVKEELSISMDNIDQEALNLSSPEAQYIIGEDDETQTLADCCHSKEGVVAEVDEDNTSYTLPNETHVEELSESRAPTQDDNDEVGSFFKAVAIKIRKANMSTMAFTELQIDILKVITDALRNNK